MGTAFGLSEPALGTILVRISGIGDRRRRSMAGVLGAELFLSRSSFLIAIAGLVVLMFGWNHLRAAIFPWLFLLFMIPIPTIVFNQVTFPLQLLASKVAAVILPVFGVPVLREGNVIQLPAMALEVAEACSGIRSLMSLATLAIIYGYLLEPRKIVRVVLALASIPIAVAANSAAHHWDRPACAVLGSRKSRGIFSRLLGLADFRRLARTSLPRPSRFASSLAKRRDSLMRFPARFLAALILLGSTALFLASPQP